MLVVKGQEIYLTRADTAYLQFIPMEKIPEQKEPTPRILQNGDKVIFRLKTNGAVFEKECLIDLEENSCILSLEPTDTINLDFQTYKYEVELVTNIQEHFTFVADQRFTIGKEYEPHDS